MAAEQSMFENISPTIFRALCLCIATRSFYSCRPYSHLFVLSSPIVDVPHARLSYYVITDFFNAAFHFSMSLPG
jgi:hypothetical protein